MLIPGKEKLGPIKGYTYVSFSRKGGLGDIHRARHDASGLLVDVMALPLEGPGRAFSEQSALQKKAPQFHHPNILRVVENGDNGAWYVTVLEHIEGDFLNAYLQKHGCFSLPAACRIALQTVDALRVIHEQGYAYLGLRTNRLTITPEGRVVLDDFGMLRPYTGDQVPETPPQNELIYMPPEAVESMNTSLPPQLDLYALAVIFYEILANEKPFNTQSTRTMIRSILTAPPPKLSQLHPSLPTAVDVFIERALAKDRDARYSNALDMKNALQGLMPQ